MASANITESKGNYYARFYDPSRSQKTKTVTLRTKQKSVARQRFTELEKKHGMGLYDPWEEDPPQEGVTVDEAVEQFLDAKRNQGCREKTISNYEYLLEDFSGSLPASSHIDRVEPQEIRDYLDNEELAQTSRDTYYRQLRTFFRWCDEESIVESNPITDVKRPGAPDKDKSFLTPERLEHLIETIRGDVDERRKWIQEGEVVWLIDVILFAVQTGMRRGEICDLRWGAVDFETGFIAVRGTEEFSTKTGDEKRIPMTEEARNVLERQERNSDDPEEHVFKGVKGGPLNGGYVSERFRHYREEADLPEDISFHSLRHSTASNLSMEGVPMTVVQEMLRHSSLETTMGYAHLNPETYSNLVQEGLQSMAVGRGDSDEESPVFQHPDASGDWECSNVRYTFEK